MIKDLRFQALSFDHDQERREVRGVLTLTTGPMTPEEGAKLHDLVAENLIARRSLAIVKDPPDCDKDCSNPASPSHTCPYQEEINDSLEECSCCDECMQQCAMDI